MPIYTIPSPKIYNYSEAIIKDVYSKFCLNKNCTRTNIDEYNDFSIIIESLSVLIKEVKTTRKRINILKKLSSVIHNRISLEDIENSLRILEYIASHSHFYTLKQNEFYLNNIVNTCVRRTLDFKPETKINWLIEIIPNVLFKYLIITASMNKNLLISIRLK